MPFITIHMYPGRTHAQKAEMARAITDAVVTIAKTTPEATQIVFVEVPREHWASAGVLASDKK
jgi:4-oxalocrotonate tautomerase